MQMLNILRTFPLGFTGFQFVFMLCVEWQRLRRRAPPPTAQNSPTREKAAAALPLVLCSIHRYDDVSSQRFDDTSIDTAGPVSILWHVCSSGPRLI